MHKLASLAPRTRVLGGRTGQDLVDGELMEGTEISSPNSFGGLNLGVVEVWRESPYLSQLRVKLYSHDDQDRPRPVVVYDSGLL